MTNSTSTIGQAAYVPQPVEIELDEFRLVEGTCRPILGAGFVTTLLSSIALSIAIRFYPSVVDCIFQGIMNALFSFIGLGAALFLGWGMAVWLGSRLNSILGKPLNPSAVAALAAAFGFGLAHTIASSGFAMDASIEHPATVIFTIVAVLGSLLFQTVARVRVKRDIARHNLRAGRKPYTEPPCHVRFQIRQMMILMVAISLFLAFAMQLAGGNLVLLAALWGILAASAFYPAIFAAQWVDQKLGRVKLKSWEQHRSNDWQPEMEPQAATAQLANLSQSHTEKSESGTESPVGAQHVDVAQLVGPLPGVRSAVKFSSYDAMSSALKWIGFAGGAFGCLLLIFLEASMAIHHESIARVGLFLAFPSVIAGMIFASSLSGFTMLCLGLINFSTGERIRTGTIAALAGGLVGSFGAWILLCVIEVVHFSPWTGAVDFSTANNLFPLAAILLASLMGQTYGRLGVKIYGHQCGLEFEKYQYESTGPAWGRFTLVALILSVCAWVVVVGHNQSVHPQTMSDFFATVIVGAFARTLLVWPAANLLARSVRVAPKRSSKPGLAWAMRLRQPQA